MGSLVVTFVVALVATWAATTSASAMTLMVETIELPRAGGSVRSFVHRLKLTGPLESGDSDKLRDTLKTLEQLGDDHDGELATIELDSRGGALEEGLRMGRLFRRFGVTTIVRRNAR